MPVTLKLADMPAGELVLGWVGNDAQVKHGLSVRRGMSLGAKEKLYDLSGGKDLAQLYRSVAEIAQARMTPAGMANPNLVKAYQETQLRIQRLKPRFLAAVVEALTESLGGTPNPSEEMLSRLTAQDRDFIATAYLAARHPQRDYDMLCMGPAGDGCFDERGNPNMLRGKYSLRDTLHVKRPAAGELEAKDGRWLFSAKSQAGKEIIAAIPTMADQAAAFASTKYTGTFGASYVLLERCVLSYGGERLTAERYRDDIEEEETLSVIRAFETPAEFGIDFDTPIKCGACGTDTSDWFDLAPAFFGTAASTPNGTEPKREP